jgi:hypothetical protein
MRDQQAARVLHVAQQRQHQGVAVDDAGGGRMQGGLALQLRLQGAGLRATQPLQIAHAVGGGARLDGLQFLLLRALAATISLPQRRWAMPRSAQ